MREIFFRGKLKDGEWVYGWYAYCSNVGHVIVEGKNVYAVEGDTVGQYTGLHDIDGNQIFEGDIVKGMFNYEWITGVVTYGDEGMFYIERDSGVGLGIREADSWLHVIGNKWDGVKE